MESSKQFASTFILDHCEPFDPNKCGTCLWYISANRIYTDYYNAAARNRISPLSFRDFSVLLKELIPVVKWIHWPNPDGPIYFTEIRYYLDFIGGYFVLDEPNPS